MRKIEQAARLKQTRWNQIYASLRLPPTLIPPARLTDDIARLFEANRWNAVRNEAPARKLDDRIHETNQYGPRSLAYEQRLF
jgi:hypothetical protein